MPSTRAAPGQVRDAIIEFLCQRDGTASVAEICAGVCSALGRPVPDSSVRSYLNLNEPATFLRTAPGHYQSGAASNPANLRLPVRSGPTE